MAITAAYIAASGLDAAQSRLDTVAGNIANIKTTAYQKWVTETSDLFYQQLKKTGVTETDGGNPRPVGVQVGTGTKVTGTYRVLEQGPVNVTKNPLDMMVLGAGYFAVNLPNGRTGYTRAGNFQIGPNRTLQTVQGYDLLDAIVIPDDVQVSTLNISDDGVMTGRGANNDLIEVGQLQLYVFDNERGLDAMGDNLLEETAASGPAEAFVPGANNLGKIKQGALEGSNVKAATEMVDLIDAQRAYEFNSKVLQASNDVQKMMADIYKG